MSIHKTKDGRWFVQYRIPGDKNKRREYYGRGDKGRRAAERRNVQLGYGTRIAAPRGPTLIENSEYLFLYPLKT